MGYGELEAYGQLKIKTPNLNKLAEEGITFTQHYTSTPVCAPARCMLLTGKHGGHSYIRGNYALGGFADSLEGGADTTASRYLHFAKDAKKSLLQNRDGW